jgi:hypothetical protein
MDLGREAGRRRWLLLLVVYLIAAGYSVTHHELWGDEIHSWNIAKASFGWRELVANTRYEGHPPAWYVILSAISRFTHRLGYLQAAEWAIAGGVVALALLVAPFPPVVKALLPFGYYFWFEYGTLARNYALGILLIFGACAVLLGRPFRGRTVVYYGLLFLASNTHLLALLLAGSLHLGGLLRVPVRGAGARRGFVVVQLLIGGLVLLPAAWFIFPPADSGMNAGFWLRSWQAAHQLGTVVRAPLRAFLPIPAWWRHDFWNTESLIELGERHGAVRLLIPLASLAFVVAAFACLRPVRASLVVFGANLLATCALAAAFPLTTARYTGFIYVGFLVAYWLRCHEASQRTPATWIGGGRSVVGGGGQSVQVVQGVPVLLVGLLLLQVAGGVFAVWRDARAEFSEGPRVGELIAEVPPGAELVTDVWTEDTVVAFTDHPLPCLGLDRPVAFLRWDTELEAITPTSYSMGLRRVFLRTGAAPVYLVSSQSTQTIFEIDRTADARTADARAADARTADARAADARAADARTADAPFAFTLVDRRDGAIERWSNLYLYRVTARPRGH